MAKKITEKDIHRLVMEAIENPESLEEVGFGWGSKVSSDTPKRATGMPTAGVAKQTPRSLDPKDILDEVIFLFNSIVPKKGLMGKTIYTVDPSTYEQLDSLLTAYSGQSSETPAQEEPEDYLGDIDFEPTAKMSSDELPTPKMGSELPTPKMASDELPTPKMTDPRAKAIPASWHPNTKTKQPLRQVAEVKKNRK